jgi:hypothetical protein
MVDLTEDDNGAGVLGSAHASDSLSSSSSSATSNSTCATTAATTASSTDDEFTEFMRAHVSVNRHQRNDLTGSGEGPTLVCVDEHVQSDDDDEDEFGGSRKRRKTNKKKKDKQDDKEATVQPRKARAKLRVSKRASLPNTLETLIDALKAQAFYVGQIAHSYMAPPRPAQLVDLIASFETSTHVQCATPSLYFPAVCTSLSFASSSWQKTLTTFCP